MGEKDKASNSTKSECKYEGGCCVGEGERV